MQKFRLVSTGIAKYTYFLIKISQDLQKLFFCLSKTKRKEIYIQKGEIYHLIVDFAATECIC